MFRTMRRIGQALTDAENEEILASCTTGVLSVCGEDGYPYGVPVNYVWSDGTIIFHGAKVGHKADAIARDDRVSFTVIEQDIQVPEKLTTYYRSVIVFGRARMLVDESEICSAAMKLGLRFNDDAEFVQKEIETFAARLACFEIIPEHIGGKQCVEFVKIKKGVSNV